MTPKAQATKEKIDKLDFMKNFKICALKDSIIRVKRQTTEWDKIFANHISDKGLIFRIYRELRKLNSKKTPGNPIQKHAKDLNRHFSREDIQMANKHMKRCLTSLITRKMQIKTTVIDILPHTH